MAEAAPGGAREAASIGRAPKVGALALATIVSGEAAEEGAESAPPTGIQHMWSSFSLSLREMCSSVSSAVSTRTKRAMEKTSSNSTQRMTPQHSHEAADGSRAAPRLADMESPHTPVSPPGEDSGRETVVGKHKIKPEMGHTVFNSSGRRFRLHVQNGKETQALGPITVEPLDSTEEEVDGEKLRGILEVHCLPDERRFDPPLLFDFRVEKDKLIIDEFGRIRYEVLMKDYESGRWIRDPECSIPLMVVKDELGQIYVRAHVGHFSIWGFFAKRIEEGPQVFLKEDVPWVQRKRHRSLIRNHSEGVHIHVFVMRMSQWTAGLESAKLGAGAEGAEATTEFTGNVRLHHHAAAFMPETVPIPPKHSHWFEIPRVGGGIRSSRKAVVAIATMYKDDGDDGRTRSRVEGVIQLRANMALTVNLPVEGGKVVGNPIAAGEGADILSQVKRVFQNYVNAEIATPLPSRSSGETSSGANDTGSHVRVSTSAADASASANVSRDEQAPIDSPGDDSESDDNNSTTESLIRDDREGSTDEEKVSTTSSAVAEIAKFTGVVGDHSTTESVNRGSADHSIEDEKQSSPPPATLDGILSHENPESSAGLPGTKSLRVPSAA